MNLIAIVLLAVGMHVSNPGQSMADDVTDATGAGPAARKSSAVHTQYVNRQSEPSVPDLFEMQMFEIEQAALEKTNPLFQDFLLLISHSNSLVNDKVSMASKYFASYYLNTIIDDYSQSLVVMEDVVRGRRSLCLQKKYIKAVREVKYARQLARRSIQCYSVIQFDEKYISDIPSIFKEFQSLPRFDSVVGSRVPGSCDEQSAKFKFAVQVRTMRDVLLLSCSSYMIMDDIVKAKSLSMDESCDALTIVARASRFVGAFRRAEAAAHAFVQSSSASQDKEDAKRFAASLREVRTAYSAKLREAKAALGQPNCPRARKPASVRR